MRIARELHDVVAHSMSVIAVQAGVGRLVLDSQPEEALRALSAIQTTSRTALTEMRRLLGVLRQEGRPRAELSPAPGLADLPPLLTQVREAGLKVASTVSGEPAEAATPIGLTAYRIVQEALTNVLKHGGLKAGVRIDYGPDDVRLEFTDDGRPSAASRRQQCNDGHGLIGMREPVAVFGGRLSAGDQPGGGTPRRHPHRRGRRRGAIAQRHLFEEYVPSAAQRESLTEREVEALALVGKGWSKRDRPTTTRHPIHRQDPSEPALDETELRRVRRL